MQARTQRGPRTEVGRPYLEYFLRCFLTALGCLLILTAAPSASAASSYPELDAFLSKVAMRPVSLLCESIGKDKALVSVWAHVRVPVGRQNEAQAREVICEGALAVAHGDENLPDWKRALGVAVILHEGYHLRHWSAAGNEGKVECKAIRHFKVAVQLLGGSPRVADELFPFALAYHYELVYLSRLWARSGVRPGRESYEDLTCEVPDLEQATDEATQEAASTTRLARGSEIQRSGWADPHRIRIEPLPHGCALAPRPTAPVGLAGRSGRCPARR